ncbi:MAG: hypothetical protein M0Q91_15615 [Methanoregula sp.]|jgi:hypothetical protein|nr:hypothetical protein [Methanoregula sp.]
MRKHNLPLTYLPKIQPVIEGRCRQTIRAGRKFSMGDQVSFHGWSGKPYRSPWSFRTPYYTLIDVLDIWIWKSKFCFEKSGYPIRFEDNPVSNNWAELDGIYPPTGEELGNVLNKFHKIGPFGLPGQIIRWWFP